METIRIGNDIELNVTLVGKSVSGKLNINSVAAYIINKTVLQQAIDNLNNKTRFISRFPLEPAIEAYSSTPYDIKCCGYPVYNAIPKNLAVGSYVGFGIKPVWGNIYKPMPNCNFSEYRAEVKASSRPDTIKVYFPAEEQMYTGVYDLVIVAKLYEPGYANNNLRTVTVDYESVFELSSSSAESSNPVIINIGGGDTPEGTPVAESISVDGVSALYENQSGSVTATVYPNTVSNGNVVWYVDTNDRDVAQILSQDGKTAYFTVGKIHSEASSRTITLHAQSELTSSVVADWQITVILSGDAPQPVANDKYVSEGSVNDNNLHLTYNTGGGIDISMSSITDDEWHYPDSINYE